MNGGVPQDALVAGARELARAALAGLPRRWRHTRAVADRAAELSGVAGEGEAPVLVAAAWLHDIGYAQAARDSGFHPLDGARYLDRLGWPGRVCGLVAYHSGAVFVAAELGLADELAVFPAERSAVADALDYADQTRGPDGQPMTVAQRLREALERHGTGSAFAAAAGRRAPYLREIAGRVEAGLAARRPVGWRYGVPPTTGVP